VTKSIGDTAGHGGDSYEPSLAEVINVENLTKEEMLLELRMLDGRALGHQPGQFVQLSLLGVGEAPISVCSSPTRPSFFELCVRSAGDVTEELHEVSMGDYLGIRGPYGKGFPLDKMQGRDVLIIAGGIGIAPLRSLIEYVFDLRREFGRFIIIYGEKNPESILFKKDVLSWQEHPEVELFLTVDRPDRSWKGRTGTLLLSLREVRIQSRNSLVVASVGPPAMYRFVAVELFKKGIREEQIFFSLERRFKCGMGKCGHCQLNDYYVCLDGPVFNYSALRGRPEAVEVWAPEREADEVKRGS
jgi:sulfite reductase subunit B